MAMLMYPERDVVDIMRAISAAMAMSPTDSTVIDTTVSTNDMPRSRPLLRSDIDIPIVGHRDCFRDALIRDIKIHGPGRRRDLAIRTEFQGRRRRDGDRIARNRHRRPNVRVGRRGRYHAGKLIVPI